MKQILKIFGWRTALYFWFHVVLKRVWIEKSIIFKVDIITLFENDEDALVRIAFKKRTHNFMIGLKNTHAIIDKSPSDYGYWRHPWQGSLPMIALGFLIDVIVKMGVRIKDVTPFEWLAASEGPEDYWCYVGAGAYEIVENGDCWRFDNRPKRVWGFDPRSTLIQKVLFALIIRKEEKNY